LGVRVGGEGWGWGWGLGWGLACRAHAVPTPSLCSAHAVPGAPCAWT